MLSSPCPTSNIWLHQNIEGAEPEITVNLWSSSWVFSCFFLNFYKYLHLVILQVGLWLVPLSGSPLTGGPNHGFNMMGAGPWPTWDQPAPCHLAQLAISHPLVPCATWLWLAFPPGRRDLQSDPQFFEFFPLSYPFFGAAHQFLKNMLDSMQYMHGRNLSNTHKMLHQFWSPPMVKFCGQETAAMDFSQWMYLVPGAMSNFTLATPAPSCPRFLCFSMSKCMRFKPKKWVPYLGMVSMGRERQQQNPTSDMLLTFICTPFLQGTSPNSTQEASKAEALQSRTHDQCLLPWPPSWIACFATTGSPLFKCQMTEL